MNLIVLHSVDYVAARVVKLARKIQVVLFVEARAQLYDHGDVYAVFAGAFQGLDYARMVCKAVYGYLYGEAVLPFGALV